MAAGRSANRRPLQSPVKAVGARRRPGQEQPRASPASRNGAAARGNASPPGVAVVSADWLLQLRDEVEHGVHSVGSVPQNQHVPVASVSPPSAPSGPREHRSPPRPAQDSPSAKMPSRPARQPRRLPARSVGVGDASPPGQLSAPALHHSTGVGTDAAVAEQERSVEPQRLKTQSTQTPTHDAVSKAEAAPTADLVQQVHVSPNGKSQTPVVSPHPSPHTPQAAPESPHGLGRCDLFGNDVYHVERERERRRQQAQMLAEQIEEQRRRKEEENRRRKEQELEEERRIEREQRELQERHAREQRRAAPPQANGVGAQLPEKVAGKESLNGTLQERRRATRESRETGDQHPRPKGIVSQTNSGTGPWAPSPHGGAGDRGRRRRRRTSTIGDATWRSGNKHTWRDTHSVEGSAERHQSSSPLQWLSGTAQDSDALGPDTVGKRGKILELQKTVDARHRRRRTRDRILQRDPPRDRDDRSVERSVERRGRHDTGYEDQWASQGRTPRETRASQWHGDEPRRRRRPTGDRGSAVAHQQVDEARGFEGKPSTKMTEDDLRQQLGSLVSLCEQLLQERAERERAERDRVDQSERSERGGGRHSGGRRSERSERSSSAVNGVVPTITPSGVGSARGVEPASARLAGTHVGRQQTGRGVGHAPNSMTNNCFAVPLGYADDHAMPQGHHGPSVRANGRLLPPTLPDTKPPAANDWPPDALAGLVLQAAVAGEVANKPGREHGLSDIQEPPSPFAAPNARGMSVRRHSHLAGYSPQRMMSPPPLSRGGLNLQANWLAFGQPPEDSSIFSNHRAGGSPDVMPGRGLGRPLGGPISGGEMAGDGFGAGHDIAADRYAPSGPKNGPGHIPIGIRPSIQAQSAMLRELYPHGPHGVGPTGTSLVP